MHNGIEMVETLFAIHRLGAVAVPMNFRLSRDEASFILDDVRAVGLIADEGLSARAAGPGWTLVRSESPDCSYEEAIAAQSAGAPARMVHDDAAAFVMYTSGTTGRPKGAVLTHTNLLVNTWNWMFEVGIARGDVYSAGLPLFHIGGLVGLYPFLYLGNLVVLQPSGGFDPDAAVDLMRRSGTTVCAYVPAQWQTIVDCSGARERLREQRRAIWGASPASRPLLEAMVETLPADSIVSTFGQTEVTANATFLGPPDALRKLGSVGRPTLTMEHRIVDDDDRDVRPGDVGEIVYRGPTVMAEYFQRPDATREAFRGGWFHGGDLVYEDPEGYIFVVDRKNDMIISGAENIYPQEIERVLAEHPQVRESAVVGVPHPSWGETPLAFVVSASDEPLVADELIRFCGERLARYKRPSRVVFVDELPRNSSGKVLKRDLRANPQINEVEA
jgi:acyl-CoA synthetase (AMP-forming)/AMP-acid ligase II